MARLNSATITVLTRAVAVFALETIHALPLEKPLILFASPYTCPIFHREALSQLVAFVVVASQAAIETLAAALVLQVVAPLTQETDRLVLDFAKGDADAWDLVGEHLFESDGLNLLRRKA